MEYLRLLELAAPETILVVIAVVVLAADLLALRDLEPPIRTLISVMLSCFGCGLAVAWMLAVPQEGNFMAGMLVVNSLTRLVKIALLVLTAFTLIISLDGEFTSHAGEYCAVVLFGAVGMMFLVSSEDILMIFLSLELTSLALYILTAFDKGSIHSAEAALKYFLFGGMSAAFTLFGFSLLYGLAGATNLGQIGAALQGPKLDPLLALAIVATVIGFGFKVAAAPFHLWAPDAYQGAPVPSAAFIASGSKVAGFFILARVMALGFKGVEGSSAWHAYIPGWVPVLAVVAAFSMLLGNLAAVVQTSVRRLLAFSAIAHAGYMLLAVMAPGTQGTAALLYYVLTYGLTTLGAFGVVAVVQGRSGGERLVDFAGLGRSAPVLSFCMLVFMLSLAGIPPLAGFFGKFYVFAALLAGAPQGSGMLWLVILAVGLSAVSLYYYLQVLKQIYVLPLAADAKPLILPAWRLIPLVLLAAGVVVLGCAPDLLLLPLSEAVRGAGI